MVAGIGSALTRARVSRWIRLALVALVAMTIGCASTAKRPTGGNVGQPAQRGLATWYASGKMTASGERFDKHALTAAHRTLPFGTRVRVTDERNGRTVIVRINDRGPFGNRRRIIDLSEAAAARLGILDDG